MHLLGDVRLRSPEPKDVEALYQQKNDREIAALLTGFNPGYTRTEISDWIQFHRNASDEALFVIAAEDDRCLGHVGLYKIDHRVGSAEFAILIGDRHAWGKGIGRRCTTFMVEFGFGHLNLRRIYLEVLASNARAIDLYRKIGFVEEGCLREAQVKNARYVDVYVMALLRAEYRRDGPASAR
jgi:ribosomal-protein-alanine N-acetyltransferase